MDYIEKIKKMLCNELEEYAMKGKLTMADLDAVHKLSDTVKNLDKIELLGDDGYSEGYPYLEGTSYGRGRMRAKRDSMGRYSSDNDGMHMDRRYSKDDAKDHMMSRLGEMMESADPNEREILKDAMRKIERA